jgi:hypothetical protein
MGQDSVSRFEWSLYNLENEHKDWKYEEVFASPGRPQLTTLKYDWDTNQILIDVSVYPFYKTASQSAKTVCAKVLGTIRNLLGVTEEFKTLRAYSGIGTYFRSKYFQRTAMPDSLDADLEAITLLTVNVRANAQDKAPFKALIYCQTRLLSSEIRYYQKEEAQQ